MQYGIIKVKSYKTSMIILSIVTVITLFFANNVSAATDFTVNHGQIPVNKPSTVIVEVNPQNQRAKPYINDLLLSVQNELLVNGFDLVIGKENVTDDKTLAMNIDYSIEHGLHHFVRSENEINYYVENISRLFLHVTFKSISGESNFVDFRIALDANVIGLSDHGFDAIEPMEKVFGRAARLMSYIALGSFSKKAFMEGEWHNALDDAVINFHDNRNNDGYVGYIQEMSRQNYGFEPGEEVFRINGKAEQKLQINGEYKVRYANGDDPEWFPADYLFLGNMMILNPTSSSSPVGLMFFYR
jgi:hypothetical protein